MIKTGIKFYMKFFDNLCKEENLLDHYHEIM